MNLVLPVAIPYPKRIFAVFGCILVLGCLTVSTDFFESFSQHSSFYLSESLLFSSYWLLYLPFTYLANAAKPSAKTPVAFVTVMVAAMVAHLMAYPALVWLLSSLFYNHTFSYSGTLIFGISQYGVVTPLLYSMAIAVLFFLRKKAISHASLPQQNIAATSPFSLLVNDNGNRKVSLCINDVRYFSANTPYVNIHHCHKKYLHTTTLKVLEAQLHHQQCIRIHKSYVVNLRHVVACQSRLNGDYDITLSDGTILRVSRNYAAAFKAAYAGCHQVTVI